MTIVEAAVVEKFETRVNVWIFYLPFGRGGHEQRRDCSVIGSKRFLAKTFEKGYSVFLF